MRYRTAGLAPRMFGLFSKDICPIGIDVGHHSVRLLQFQRRGRSCRSRRRRVTLESLGRGSGLTHRLAAAINHSLGAGKFAGKRAVLSLPPAMIHAKSVRLPQMPDSDLAQAARWEAKDRFGFRSDRGLGGIVWFRVCGEVRRGTGTQG